MILNTIYGTFGRFIKATDKIITQTRKLWSTFRFTRRATMNSALSDSARIVLNMQYASLEISIASSFWTRVLENSSSSGGKSVRGQARMVVPCLGKSLFAFSLLEIMDFWSNYAGQDSLPKKHPFLSGNYSPFVISPRETFHAIS